MTPGTLWPVSIGRERFFDRSDPARRHRPPDFALPERPDKPSLQVFTGDGVNFTPLP